MKSRTYGVLALALLAAACGTNREDRVTGGAAAGAATGAGVGALGGPVGVAAGAAIGGGVGAVTGASTDASQVNLGEPVWNDPNLRVPGVTDNGSRGSARASSQTRDLQRALSQRGFNPGPADGIYGPRTRQAVMDWQRQNNMQATGRPDSRMLSDLGVSSSGTSRSAQSDANRAYMGGGMVVDERNRSGNTNMRTGSGTTDTRTGSGSMSPGNAGGGPGTGPADPADGGAS